MMSKGPTPKYLTVRCGRFAAVCATRDARLATSTAALACVASHPRIDHPDPAIYYGVNPQ